MKQIRTLAQFYVNSMVKLGLVRFSLLLALILILLAIAVQVAVTMVLSGEVVQIDLVRSIFFGVLITPWAVYFLSIVVEQVEESRQRLANLVDKLREMRHRDQELTARLQSNIKKLNQEIEERAQVEKSLAQALLELKQEVKQRKQAQIELSQQSTLLRSILDASPDLVYYRNELGEFFGCNRAMELLVGMGQQQLVGLTPYDVYSSEVAERVMETDEKVFRFNVALTYEQWLVYPDGHKACFELRKVPFYDRIGKRQGLIGFGRDITERKRYQDALEKASQEKTTFISTISHELRTPLNGIVGLSRILLDTALSEEQTNYLKTIHVSAITLGNIFNDIIEMDKIGRKKIQIDRQPVQLVDFLSDLENLAGLMVQPKKLQFSLQVTGELPARLQLDDTRVRQIIWNLLSNAIKFTREGGITIQVSYDPEAGLRFAVQDTGIGIPEQELQHIFAMYYQVREKDGGSPGIGTGIGLAVSKRLAQAMGGDIVVSSEPGQGSCFTLSVQAPLVELPQDNMSQESELLPVLHILLVEDIELNVIVARSVLEKLGSSVDVATNGAEALALFDPDEYDLVLLDIQLPDMSGFDIARKIKKTYGAQTLPPLVALTANVLKNRQEYLEAGMDDVLSKPLSVPALTAVIHRFWSHEPQTAATRSPVQEEIVQPDCAEVLDIEMLTQYISLVGEEVILQGITLFEQMMPAYLAILDDNMIARDQKGIEDEGHKIKGAAGSIGLKHLQLLAKQIQTPALPAWWDNVKEWVDELKSEWRADIEILKQWIELQRKK
ncbi:MAG: aerobic respiration two-component sensor histidine kinase ArcB [Enterobacteriaceae bacterium]